jgi:hypothetical protein
MFSKHNLRLQKIPSVEDFQPITLQKNQEVPNEH